MCKPFLVVERAGVEPACRTRRRFSDGRFDRSAYAPPSQKGFSTLYVRGPPCFILLYQVFSVFFKLFAVFCIGLCPPELSPEKPVEVTLLLFIIKLRGLRLGESWGGGGREGR